MNKPLYILISIFLLSILFPPTIHAVSLESYCRDGYYQIPGEQQCSRAPRCGGKSYDEVKVLPQPNPQECMGDGTARDQKGCAGYVPLCCYELARTGDPLMCVGYWERLWCHPSQCDKIDLQKSLACQQNPSTGLGTCQCAHAYSIWCGCPNCAAPIPIETRLGMNPPPTNPPPTTRPTQPPQPTTPPYYSPTPTIRLNPTYPNQPTTSRPTAIPTTPRTTNQPTTIPPSGGVFFPTSQPFQPTTSPPAIFVFPKLLFLHIDIKEIIPAEKIETAAAKPLGFFEYVFITVTDLDKQLENTINSFFHSIIR